MTKISFLLLCFVVPLPVALAQELGSSSILQKSKKIEILLASRSADDQKRSECTKKDTVGPVFNTYPEMDASDEPSLCNAFPFILQALVEKDPKFLKNRTDSIISFRNQEKIVILVFLLNTAPLGNPENVGKDVTMETTIDRNDGDSVTVVVRASNGQIAKRGSIKLVSAPPCRAILLRNSGAIYNYKGFRLGPSRLNIREGKFTIGDIAPGWENSRFITFLMEEHC